MGLRCKGCGGEEHVKNGFMRGKQRYRCKACGLDFTHTPPRGMPPRVKVAAVPLYLSGLSMNRTAKLLGVSTPSVMARIERFAKAYAQKPEPEGRAVVELGEMWHFLKKGQQTLGLEGSGRIHGRSATGQAKRICTSLPSSLSSAWSGVRKPRHFRGVRLWLSTISCGSASLMASRSRSRGRSRRSRPFAFSTAPFCQEA